MRGLLGLTGTTVSLIHLYCCRFIGTCKRNIVPRLNFIRVVWLECVLRFPCSREELYSFSRQDVEGGAVGRKR